MAGLFSKVEDSFQLLKESFPPLHSLNFTPYLVSEVECGAVGLEERVEKDSITSKYVLGTHSSI